MDHTDFKNIEPIEQLTSKILEQFKALSEQNQLLKKRNSELIAQLGQDASKLTDAQKLVKDGW